MLPQGQNQYKDGISKELGTSEETMEFNFFEGDGFDPLLDNYDPFLGPGDNCNDSGSFFLEADTTPTPSKEPSPQQPSQQPSFLQKAYNFSHPQQLPSSVNSKVSSPPVAKESRILPDDNRQFYPLPNISPPSSNSSSPFEAFKRATVRTIPIPQASHKRGESGSFENINSSMNASSGLNSGVMTNHRGGNIKGLDVELLLKMLDPF